MFLYRPGQKCITIIAIFVFCITKICESTPVPSTDDNEVLPDAENIPIKAVSVEESRRNEVLRNITGQYKRYMNTEVDPCDNFYEYVCGNFRTHHTIPAEKSAFTVDLIIYERLEEITKEVLEEEIEAAEGTDVVNARKKASDLYKMCINMDERRQRGIQPLFDFIESLGGWHVFNENWNEEEFDLVNLSSELVQFGISTLFNIYVSYDYENPDNYVFAIDQITPLDELPKSDLETNAILVDFIRNIIEESLALLGVSPEMAYETSQDIMEFSIKLRNLSVDKSNLTDFTLIFERMTLEELQKKIPGIDWFRYFRTVYGDSINSTQIVNILSKPFIYQLPELISNTSPKTLSNFIFWNLLVESREFADDRFDEIIEKYQKILFGKAQIAPLSKRCLNLVRGHIRKPIEAVFLEKYFDRQSKIEATEMTENLRKSFQKMIINKDWLDDNTKEEVLRKLSDMKFLIGYPDDILSEVHVNEEYENLEIVPNKFFESGLNVARFEFNKNKKRLGTKSNRTEWLSSIMIVNAFFSRPMNRLLIPAGHLQPPHYNRYFPKAMNFGAVGMVIGHEISHAFDRKGRRFDSSGRIQNVWSNQSTEVFEELAECFVEQYDQYNWNGIPIRGKSTENENISDLGGLRAAYYAYKDWLEQQNTTTNNNLVLPGLNLTDTQLFFVAFGHAWCGTTRPEALENHLKTGVHSPAQFRVQGTLSNFEKFSEAFNCPTGSNMNPEKKCNIW